MSWLVGFFLFLVGLDLSWGFQLFVLNRAASICSRVLSSALLSFTVFLGCCGGLGSWWALIGLIRGSVAGGEKNLII